MEYMSIAFYKITWIFFTWAGAWYLLSQIISTLNANVNPTTQFNAHMYAMGLGLAGLFSSLAIHQQYAECNRVGVKVKVIFLCLILGCYHGIDLS